MKSVKQKTLLIIEEDEEYIEILADLLRSALAPLRISDQGNIDSGQTAENPEKILEESDLYLAVAKTPEETRAILQEGDVYLATVDINLSNAPRGTAAEGMEILEKMQTDYPHTCAIIVSAEDPGLHMRRALRKLGVVDFFQKSELYNKETEFLKLLKNTVIYAEAVRLFSNQNQWTRAEQNWTSILKDFPGFKDNDVKDLGELLKDKKSDVTGLPGQEWIQAELKHLFLGDTFQSVWAIVIVEIHNFKPFQDRAFGEAADVLKTSADILRKIREEVSDAALSPANLFSSPLEQPDHNGPQTNIFLGEVDNTGRFIFVTPSRKIAASVKKLTDERLTKETFRVYYRLTEDKEPEPEYEAGYFISQGKKTKLMWVSTRIVTPDDILEPEPPSDVKEFEERVFG